MMQLDLFDKLQAKILPFPPRRMTATIKAAAERVNTAGNKTRHVLDREVGLLHVRYWRIGLPEDEAISLANVYEYAVIAEVYRLRTMARLGMVDHPNSGGGR